VKELVIYSNAKKGSFLSWSSSICKKTTHENQHSDVARTFQANPVVENYFEKKILLPVKI